MPVNYVIYREQRLVMATGSGRVTFAEAKARLNEASIDPDFDPFFNEIIDFRAVTALDMSGSETGILAKTKLFSSNSKRALVASSPAIFGMGRLFATYNEMSRAPSRVCVFSDLPSALKWLGIENSPEPKGAVSN